MERRHRKNMVIPQHVAIILDGNGRWAKKRGSSENYGHKQGCETVEQICRGCSADWESVI